MKLDPNIKARERTYGSIKSLNNISETCHNKNKTNFHARLSNFLVELCGV